MMAEPSRRFKKLRNAAIAAHLTYQYNQPA
jgi:hypothetical protein